MQLSPFGKKPSIEITESTTINMEIVLTTGGEIDVSIYWAVDKGDVLDCTHWCWLETFCDHGKYHCKECREEGDSKTFDTAESLYLDHFSPIIEAVNQAREFGYVLAHIGERWSGVKLPKSVDEEDEDGWVKIPIGIIELCPLKARKGRHKHARAIHTLIAAKAGLTNSYIFSGCP